MIKKLYMKYREPILYIIIGGLTTLVNWIVYGVCVHILPIRETEQLVFIGNIIAWIVAVLFAYITNKKWVFRSKTDTQKELLREFIAFVGARLFTGAIEIISVPLLVMAGLNQTLFDTEGFIAKIIVSVVVVILNYVFSKLFIFRKKA